MYTPPDLSKFAAIGQNQSELGNHNKYIVLFQTRVFTAAGRTGKPKHTRLKFDLEQLKNPNLLETFQAMIGGKFAPLTIMNNENVDMDSMVTTFNTAETETATETLDKDHQKKKP